jgi:hypothetical protein
VKHRKENCSPRPPQAKNKRQQLKNQLTIKKAKDMVQEVEQGPEFKTQCHSKKCINSIYREEILLHGLKQKR